MQIFCELPVRWQETGDPGRQSARWWAPLCVDGSVMRRSKCLLPLKQNAMWKHFMWIWYLKSKRCLKACYEFPSLLLRFIIYNSYSICYKPFSSLPSVLQVPSFIYSASYSVALSKSQLGHSQISNTAVCCLDACYGYWAWATPLKLLILLEIVRGARATWPQMVEDLEVGDLHLRLHPCAKHIFRKRTKESFKCAGKVDGNLKGNEPVKRRKRWLNWRPSTEDK